MINLPEIRDPIVGISTTNYTLTNAVTAYEIDAADAEEVESVIDGTAGMIYKGKRLRGDITMFAIEATTLTALKGAERTSVRLWPFGAGLIPGKDDKFYPWTDVLLLEVIPFHADNALYQDAVIIRFKSVAYYEVAWASSLGYTP